VLDWEDAAIGDPLSDVACCRLELRYVLGASGAEVFTRRYAQQTQLPLAELPVWDAYVAAAALASMGTWGLAVEREARMRREAEAVLSESTSPPTGGAGRW
jgi:aminoglycoside phosphotransferase (APT) family kinase protein